MNLTDSTRPTNTRIRFKSYSISTIRASNRHRLPPKKSGTIELVWVRTWPKLANNSCFRLKTSWISLPIFSVFSELFHSYYSYFWWGTHLSHLSLFAGVLSKFWREVLVQIFEWLHFKIDFLLPIAWDNGK